MALKLHILHPNYKWNGAPVARRGGPPGIVWHHTVGFGSPEFIHKIHLNIGDRGIAYHFYIRRDGKVYAGRPENTMGAHCLGHNDCIGVALEGNYEAHDDMPDAQLKAAQALAHYLHVEYGRPDWQHKNMSGNSTACPGRHFNFDKITEITVKPDRTKLTDRNVTVPRQKKPRRAGWWNFGLVPYLAKVRKQGDGDRAQAGNRDPLIIPVPETRPAWWRKVMLWKKANR